MTQSVPKLLTPWTCRGLTLPNRCVIAPMCTALAEAGTNMLNDKHLVHYGALSMGGYGLIIVEATAVEYEGSISKFDIGIHTPEQIQKHREVNEFIHANSQSKTCVQIAHAGRKGLMNELFSANLVQLTPEDEFGGRIVSASALAAGSSHSVVPHALTTEEVEEMVQKFATASKNAVAAGYDCIEIHGAHGYLINQFLSSSSNQRTDKYGGSMENRTRFLLEIVSAMRKVIPLNMPLLVRLSAVDWMPNGWSVQDTVELSRKLKDAGVDVVHVSSGGVCSAQKIPEGDENYQIKLSAEVKKGVEIETIAVGNVRTIEKAEEILTAGSSDMVAVARIALKDPYWLRNEVARMEQQTWYPNYQAMGYFSVRKMAAMKAAEEAEGKAN